MKYISRFFGFEIVRSTTGIRNQLKEEIKNQFTKNSINLLHIGANRGQERFLYNEWNLNVLWIEGDPETFIALEKNVAELKNQKAVRALLDDKVRHADFFIANNDGNSSSLFQLADNHGFEKIGLEMVGKKNLITSRLDDLDLPEIVSAKHWIVDVQGNELQVLKGGINALKKVTSLQVEVSTRKIYKNSTLYEELREFLENQGFFPLWEPEINYHEDVIFLKRGY